MTDLNDMWKKEFRKTKEIVSRKIAGETILVPVSGNLADMQRIFSMNALAEFIWDRLDGVKQLGDIRSEILDRFEVGQEQADRDIQEFVEGLLKAGLITGE